MRKLTDLFVWTTAGVLLLAQVGSCATAEDALPHWLVGLIAVCVFLVLVFGFMMVNYYFCEDFYEEPDPENDIYTGVVEEKPSYENDGFQVDDEMPATPKEHEYCMPSVSIENESEEKREKEVMSTSL